jgi:dihydrofolate reductase
MTVFTRMCTSLDGFITTPEGMPVQLAFDRWDAGALGFYELQARCAAVLMGRTTFEPALGAPHWPWGDLPVYVLGSSRPEGTPDRVVLDSDPVRLLDRMRAETGDADVHLIGGPSTIETVRSFGALDEIRLLVLPLLTGEGRRLTPELDLGIGFELQEVRSWPADVVELRYSVRA